METRKEYLEWCKQRANFYIDNGDLENGFLSMMSDLRKHPETKEHISIGLGLMLKMGGHLSTKKDMTNFINGIA